MEPGATAARRRRRVYSPAAGHPGPFEWCARVSSATHRRQPRQSGPQVPVGRSAAGCWSSARATVERVDATLPDERWPSLLGADPRGWLLASDEPAARWSALTELLDVDPGRPEAVAAHAATLADRGTRALLDRIPEWEVDNHLSGHSSPGFAPNLLTLLADLGVRAGDDERVERLLDAFMAHPDAHGRFMSLSATRTAPTPVWGALLCDTHAVTDVLVRFGRADEPRVVRALDRMSADLVATPQGLAWPCLPHPVTGFRGPGRVGDACPQVTLEAVRTWARLPSDRRPEHAADAARTAVRVWARRGDAKPYMFGHGRQFTTVKWPTFWYDAFAVLDAVGRFPETWSGPTADPVDRRSVAELVACLVAYNVGPDGTVTPRSCYRGFSGWSFGQKVTPSAFATARVAVVLRRFDELTEDVAAVDVAELASSRGGTGRPVPPRTTAPRT